MKNIFSKSQLFPRAIIHIDGDAFFASCEQSRNPALRGKPVITGKERGIASSMSYEAKAMGITRAMPLWEIKKLCPEAILLPSDYETYSLLSKRFYTIVRRYTADVEEYGIDECFADITGWDKPLKMSYAEIAKHLQETLNKELGFTFSIGLAPNKILAKLGSKHKKPYGLTIISLSDIPRYLENLPIEKIWGIGPQTSTKLIGYGYNTALKFANAKEDFVNLALARPFFDIWKELNGEFVMPLFENEKTSYGSIQKFRTFTPPSCDADFVYSQLSKNIENACIKLRRYNQATKKITIFLRTQQFEHSVFEIELERPTNLPSEILRAVQKIFMKMYKKNTLYRATGIVTCDLTPMVLQPDLFKETMRLERMQKVYASTDAAAAKYGKHSLFLGTSWKAHNLETHSNERGDNPARKNSLFLGETKRRRLNIPMLMLEGI